MSNIDEEYPDFDYIEIKSQTPHAYLFKCEDDIEVWIPKSEIELNEENNTFNIPLWLAEKKGLV